MSFIETQLDKNVSYGAKGGPVFSTTIVQVNSGAEYRNQNWAYPLQRFDVSHVNKSSTERDALLATFYAVGGRANGFRYFDWNDYIATTSNGILGAGVGTGSPTYQLYKNYTFGSTTKTRKIVKPQASGFAVYRGGVLQTAGAGAGNYSLDSTTGIVTFVADVTKNVDANSAKTITAITRANPGQVTAVGHGFANGDKVKITSVSGMTQVNNLYFTITVVDADNFTIGVDSSGYTAYTSGGTATKYGITQTSPVQVNSAAHGFNNGDVVYISGAVGMTQVNALTFTVANKTTNRFELSGINGTAYTAYTSSATIKKFPIASETLTWAGQFDVPVRFDSDALEFEISDLNAYTWGSITLTELRL